MEGAGKNVRFSAENWPYLGNAEGYGRTKVTINH